MFVRGFIVLEWLSSKAAGMTVGELQRNCKDYSKSQLERTLKELAKDGLVLAEKQGGHGFGKIVYSLHRNVAVNCELLAGRFFAQEAAK